MAKAFFDTNVLLSLLSGDVERADRAEETIAAKGIVSIQVLNEFAAVASRKLGMEWRDIRDVLSQLREVCAVVPLTIDIHTLGLDIAQRYQLRIFEALVVASAIDADCTTLYSEDLQDGRVFKSGLKVRNPFLKKG